jgi:hypothetical protein
LKSPGFLFVVVGQWPFLYSTPRILQSAIYFIISTKTTVSKCTAVEMDVGEKRNEGVVREMGTGEWSCGGLGAVSLIAIRYSLFRPWECRLLETGGI